MDFSAIDKTTDKVRQEMVKAIMEASNRDGVMYTSCDVSLTQPDDCLENNTYKVLFHNFR